MLTLDPVFKARDRRQFEGRLKELALAAESHEKRIPPAGRNSFTVDGFCNPCQREVAFRVDYQAGGNPDDGPNWRERMVCPSCHMSNRQRLIASLVWQEIAQAETQQRIYLMEQTTPLYIWMRNRFKAHSITGSEYFGKRFESGTRITPFDYQASWNARHPLRS